MATAKFSFEGGTNGANLAAGAGAGTGDTNFDVVNIGSGATNIYDNTHPGRGSLGLKIATGATSTTSYVSWTTTIGTQTTTFIRGLVYITGAPAANTRVFNFVGSASSRGNVLLNAAGKFILTNAAGGTVLTTATLPVNSQFRFEAKFVASNTVGQWEYKIWYNPRSVGAPDDTQTSAATQVLGGTTDTYRFGIGVALANGGPYWLDDVGVSTVDYIGPENPQVTGTAAATAKKSSMTVQGFTGTATITAKKSSLDIVDKSTVTGAVSLKKMRIAGSVTETTTISGGPKLKKMKIAGSVTGTTTISGAIRLKKMRVAGSVTGITTISGAIRLKKMRVAGSITVVPDTSEVSGVIHLKKIKISGSIAGITTISGGPRLKKMRVSGSSIEMAVISGGPAMKKMHIHVNAVHPVASPLMVFTPV